MGSARHLCNVYKNTRYFLCILFLNNIAFISYTVYNVITKERRTEARRGRKGKKMTDKERLVYQHVIGNPRDHGNESGMVGISEHRDHG